MTGESDRASSALTRIYVLSSDADAAARRAALELVAARDLGGVFAQVDASAARSIALSLGREASSLPQTGSIEAKLAEAAARCPRGEVLIVADSEFARRAAAAALGLSSDALPIALESALTAIDWPSDPVGDARPALAGLDLDWLPPSPRSGTRFPGGPGSAASGR